MRSTPMTVDEVTKKLRSSLRYLQGLIETIDSYSLESHDRDRTALARANNQIETAEENLKELEKDHKR